MISARIYSEFNVGNTGIPCCPNQSGNPFAAGSVKSIYSVFVAVRSVIDIFLLNIFHVVVF